MENVKIKMKKFRYQKFALQISDDFKILNCHFAL